MSKFFLLVASNHGTRKTTISIPAAGLGAGVAPGHPPQELPVINDEVSIGELMRIEHKGSDAQ